MPLYKYVTSDRIDILENGRIRFSQPGTLNDPFEMKPNLEKILESEELKESLHKARENFAHEASAEMVDIVLTQEPGMDRDVALELLSQFTMQRPEHETHIINRFLDDGVDSTPNLTQVSRRLLSGYLDSLVGVLCLTGTATNVLMWAHYAQNHQGFAIEFDDTHPFFYQTEGSDDETGYLRPVVYAEKRPVY